MKHKSRSLAWFYLLVSYVTIQFLWWGYHLVNLSDQVYTDAKAESRFWMIIGEGAVFLVLLLIAVWQLRKSIKKELELNKQRKNFLLSTTHELKTPISVIQLYLQTLKRNDLPPEKKAEAIEQALAENARLNNMIENMLLASRINSDQRSFNMVEGDIIPVVEQGVNQMRMKHPNRSIQTNFKGDLSCTFDSSSMHSIVTNLIDNALKYSSGDKPVDVVLEGSAESVKLKVKDKGAGIENKGDVIKLFYREQDEDTRSSKGTGLGLYIVAELCKAQNFGLDIKDNDGGGTQIIIRIPK